MGRHPVCAWTRLISLAARVARVRHCKTLGGCSRWTPAPVCQSATAGCAHNGCLVHAMFMGRGAPGGMGVASHLFVDICVGQETRRSGHGEEPQTPPPG